METRITELVELTTIETGDIFPLVDINDVTQSASGSTKKITIANLQAHFDATLSFLSSGDNVSSLTNDAGYITSNLTHTGEVTGAATLTVDKTAITNKTLVTAAAGDFILVTDATDSDNLKKVNVSDFLGGANTIYSADDTLAGNRTITTGSNTFDIKLGVNSKFHIAADGRMGIGTDVLTAGSQLTVTGNINNKGSLYSTTGSIAYGSALVAGVTAVFNGGGATGASIQYNGNLKNTAGPTQWSTFVNAHIGSNVEPSTIGGAGTNKLQYLQILGSTTLKSQINFKNGAAVTSPQNGDMYRVGNDIFYYDGTSAKSMIATGGGNTIYSADDSLAGNRIVNATTNNLTFRTTGDANMLFIDGTNSKVGIGTNTPTELFTVAGTTIIDTYCEIKAQGTIAAFGHRDWIDGTTPAFRQLADGRTYVMGKNELHLDLADGTAANDMTLNLTGFGIGTASPTEKLHVAGTNLFANVSGAVGINERVAATALNIKAGSGDSKLIVAKDSSDNIRMDLRANGYFKLDTLATSVVGIGGSSTGGKTLKLYNNSDTYDFLICENGSAATVAEIHIDGSFGIGTTADIDTWANIAASTTAKSNLNLPATGVAPTAPNNGDIWFDGTNLNIRIGGVTRTVDVT